MVSVVETPILISPLDRSLNEVNYKNQMKINMNMAVGFVKKALLRIILETNDEIKDKMFDLLEQKIEKYLVPIKKNRHYTRNHSKKNKYL